MWSWLTIRGSPNRFILEANEKTSRLFWAPWKLLPGGPQQAIIWHFMVSELQLKWSTMCHMSKKGRINKTTLDWHIHRCCNMFRQKCRVLLYLKKTGMRRLNAYNNLYQAFWTPLLMACFFRQPRSSIRALTKGRNLASVPVRSFLKPVFIWVHFVLRPVLSYILAIFLVLFRP